MLQYPLLYAAPLLGLLYGVDTACICGLLFLSTVALLIERKMSRSMFFLRLIILFGFQIQMVYLVQIIGAAEHAKLPTFPDRQRPQIDIQVNSHVIPPENSALRGADKVQRLAPKQVLRTLSVVLPCINENELAEKTILSVYDSTPAEELLEIIVVDDGSEPPLRERLGKFEKTHKLKILRHPKQVGLIGSKTTGGNAASGDIVVFFDCHVKPRDGWTVDVFSHINTNYKRVVVPMITSLNAHTWEEDPHSGASKCYLTFDANFPWVSNEVAFPEVPIMSGGLLAMSKKWWNETEGYDSQMIAWGGENIDQSLRTWLCGGEILTAENSFVGHMFRIKGDKLTEARYTQAQGAVIRNRFRAIQAWFGELVPKAYEYPDFMSFGRNAALVGNLDNIKHVQEKLGCKPFPWFLWRFRELYINGGIIPKKVFMLRDSKTNMCIESMERGIRYAPCSPLSKFQKWHSANWMSPKDPRCCSGLRQWNFDHCISHSLSTSTCHVTGENEQNWSIHQGRISTGPMGSGDCIVPSIISISLQATPCRPNGVFPHQVFHIDEHKRLVNTETQWCVQNDPPALLPCSDKSYTVNSLKDRLEFEGQIITIEDGMVLTKPQEAGKLKFTEEGLVKVGNMCLEPFVPRKEGEIQIILNSCEDAESTPGKAKAGQRWKKIDLPGNQFLLKDEAYNLCMKAGVSEPLAAPCPEEITDIFRWQYYNNGLNIQNVETKYCFDANDNKNVLMYVCYEEGHNPKQNFIVNESGHVKCEISQLCMDYTPGRTGIIETKKCYSAPVTFWEKANEFEPIEHQLFYKAMDKYGYAM